MKTFLVVIVVFFLFTSCKKEHVEIGQDRIMKQSALIIPGWEVFNPGFVDTFTDVLAFNNQVIFFSEDYIYIPDVSGYTQHELPLYTGSKKRPFVAFENKLYTISDGKVCYSSDGINWTITDIASNYLTANSNYVISVCTAGMIQISPDGLNWRSNNRLQSLMAPTGIESVKRVHANKDVVYIETLEMSMSRSYISFDYGLSWESENNILANIYDILVNDEQIIFFGSMQSYMATTIVKNRGSDEHPKLNNTGAGLNLRFVANNLAMKIWHPSTNSYTYGIGEMDDFRSPPSNIIELPSPIIEMRGVGEDIFLFLEDGIYKKY